MPTSLDFYKKYGDPGSKKFIKSLVIWNVPKALQMGNIPKRIYTHPDMIPLFEQAFKNLVDRGLFSEIKTWDGVWNHRSIRGYEKKFAAAVAAGNIELAMKYLSTHSWASACDINQSENGLGQEPKLSANFVKCFTDAGFVWGGNFKRKDGMHFERAKL